MARTLDSLFAGSLSRIFSCVRATGALTTRMGHGLLGLQSVDCSNTAIRSRAGDFSSRLARCRLLVSPSQIRRVGERYALDPKSRRVVGLAPAVGHADSRDRRAPRTARDRKLVLCFWQRRAHMFHAPDCYRHTACADLRTFCGRSVEQPTNPQSRRFSGLVHTSPARMGFKLHGCDCLDPYGAGLPLWSLQVSPRADLDRWRPFITGDAWHGLYRTGIAI